MNARSTTVALVAALALILSACGSSGSGSGSSSGDSSSPIKIGASIPLSGELAGFGSFQKWGYQHVVDDINKAGGLDVDGKKRKVELTILDDKTDPNTTSSNISRLVTQDKVVGLLGSCTPALVNAGALIAERSKVPMVTGCDPLEAFKSVKRWTWVHDIFFAEPDLAAASFKTLNMAKADTNKKIALLHDNGPDGEGLGKALPVIAKTLGYQVVINESFPVASTQFGSLVQKAKASGADIVFVDAVTPQAISIRKQMASVNFTPKVLIMEKGGEPVQFAQALGKLSNGILVGGYWDPSFPFPGAKELQDRFEKETGNTASQHIADSTAAAQVLLDGISTAGSTENTKVNDAIHKTNKEYVVGRIKFDEFNTSKLPVVTMQWQDGKAIIVGPNPDQTTGKLIFPLP